MRCNRLYWHVTVVLVVQVFGVPVVLETQLGDLMGDEFYFLSKKIRSFLGVPFAEPPIELQRFRIAKSKRSWSGILNTTELSRACFQARDDYNATFWGSEMWNANTEISEDCLYVNIWAPADAYNLTVMVWFFGGGFYSGSPSLSLYDGKTLAAAGNVIVVNVNYRLGPFGFLYLDHPDVPGNMGLLDQKLALHWIRDNIVAFGGDPGKVCLFGESAGAASIVAHLVAPGANKLFHNVILQSGSLDNKWAIDSPTRARQKSEQLVELTIACLRLVPPQLLLKYTWQLKLSFLEFPFVIVSRDENFFRHTDAFISLREGQFPSHVNVMIGMNKDEGNFWNIYHLADFFDKAEHPQLNKYEFETCVDRVIGIQPDIVRSAAKFVYSDPNCTDPSQRTNFYARQINHVVGDYFFTCDSLWLARHLTSIEGRTGRVYVYHFAQPSSANPWPKWTGAMHGYEIEFVFGAPLSDVSYKRRETILSKKVVQFWTSFATHGRPQLNVPKRTETWPEYDGANKTRWMMLKGGSNVRAVAEQKVAQCRFWRRVKDAEYTAYLTETFRPPSSSASATATRLISILFFGLLIII